MAIEIDKKINLLGELLLNCGLINQEQLQEALARHKKGGERIGEALISLGAITQDEINWALGTQLNIPYLELNKEMVDQDLVRSFPADILRRYQVIPVIKVNGEIVLAMADPTDTQAINDMEALAKARIKVALATSSNIFAIIDKIFGPIKADKEETPKLQIQLEEMDRQTLEKLIRKDISGNTFVNHILIQAIKEMASEIHIQPTSNSVWVRYRIKGTLQDRGSYPIELFSQILTRIKIMGGFVPLGREGYEENYVETQILDKVLDLHISFLPALYGESILIRLISQRKVLPRLEDCGFDIKEISYLSDVLLKKPAGVIIVTGGEKSGRTSTLYSLLGRISSPQKKIITIEDDIQHRVGEFVQIETKRGSYSQALENALRHNPDVIMIKDLADKDVLNLSFHAALTGRLILGELSYKNSFDALEYLLSADLERILISSTLLLIIAQKLVYRLCDKCKEAYSPGEIEGLELGEDTTLYRAKNCRECNLTGVTDRIFINEILPVSPEIEELILTGEHRATIYQKAKEAGMKTIFDKGLEKVKEGIISLEEILDERKK